MSYIYVVRRLRVNCSTCFERHTADHQELKSCNCSLWFYICFWLPVAAAMAEQLRNIGIINSTTRSHLVGYFYKIYIMMHGSMNNKCSNCMLIRYKSERYISIANCLPVLKIVLHVRM